MGPGWDPRYQLCFGVQDRTLGLEKDQGWREVLSKDSGHLWLLGYLGSEDAGEVRLGLRTLGLSG